MKFIIYYMTCQFTNTINYSLIVEDLIQQNNLDHRLTQYNHTKTPNWITKVHRMIFDNVPK